MQRLDTTSWSVETYLTQQNNMKKKHIIIPLVIYPFDVLVSLGEEHSVVVKTIKKSNYELDHEKTESLWMKGVGRTVMLKGGQTVIRLDNKNQGIIAHEVFHAVHFIFDKIGIELCQESGESFAYLIQYLVSEINKKMK